MSFLVSSMTRDKVIATVNGYHELLAKVRGLEGSFTIYGGEYRYSEADELWYDGVRDCLWACINEWGVKIPVPMELLY